MSSVEAPACGVKLSDFIGHVVAKGRQHRREESGVRGQAGVWEDQRGASDGGGSASGSAG